jgi:hypothetical protein
VEWWTINPELKVHPFSFQGVSTSLMQVAREFSVKPVLSSVMVLAGQALLGGDGVARGGRQQICG